MLPGKVTQSTIRALDWLSAKFLPVDPAAPHIATGRQGEEDAYFYLRRQGYTIIARNFRSPNHRGELDLIGYHNNTLCFIEVKTRTTRAIKPAEAAVDREKQDDLRHVAHDFLRHLPTRPSCRFDVLAVYYDREPHRPTFELFQNAFSLAYNRGLTRDY